MFRLSDTISTEKEVVGKAIAAANGIPEGKLGSLSQNELALLVLKVGAKEHIQNADFNRRIGISPCIGVVYQNFRKAHKGETRRGFCFYELAATHFPLPPPQDALGLLHTPTERRAAIAVLAKIGKLTEKQVVRLSQKKLTTLVLSVSVKYQVQNEQFNREIGITPGIWTSFRKFSKTHKGQSGPLFYHYIERLGFRLSPLSDFKLDIPRVSDKESLCRALAKAGGITEEEVLALSPLCLTRLVLSDRIIKLIRSPEFNREIGVFPRPIEIIRKFLESGEGKNPYGQSLYGLAKLHFKLVPAEEALADRRSKEYAAERRTVLKALAKIGNMKARDIGGLPKERLTGIVRSASIYRQINNKRFNHGLGSSPSMYTVYKKFREAHPEILHGQTFYELVKYYGFELLAPSEAPGRKFGALLPEKAALIKAKRILGDANKEATPRGCADDAPGAQGLQAGGETACAISPPASREDEGPSVVKVRIGEKSMLLPGRTVVLDDGMPLETVSAKISSAPIGTRFAFILSRPPAEIFRDCVSAISGNGMTVIGHNSVEHTGQVEKEGPSAVLFEKGRQAEVSQAWFSNRNLVVQVGEMLGKILSFAASAAKNGDGAALEGAKGALADYAAEVKQVPFGNPVLSHACNRSLGSIALLDAGRIGNENGGNAAQLKALVAESSQHLAMLKAIRPLPSASKSSPPPIRTCRT